MSDQGGPVGGNMQDLVSKQQQLVIYAGKLVQILTNLFPRVVGSFTMAAAATTTVANTDVQSGAIIQLVPSNAAAATLQGSTKYVYPSVVNGGTGFVVATASGGNAVGTETFSYIVWNPV